MGRWEGILDSAAGNISANKARFGGHFDAARPHRPAYSAAMEVSRTRRIRLALRALAAALWIACGLWLLPGRAQAEAAPALGDELTRQVQQLASGAGQGTAGPRVEVEVGQLDPRLRLAPCATIEPYLPAGARPWGRSRVGLRCTSGPSRWNVWLPITVKVFGPALVLRTPLPAGSVLAAADLVRAEVDLAEEASNPLLDADLAIGRTLAQALRAGQGLRQAHLRPRQWFAAGETVRVLARGAGFSVAGEGQALTPGLEGQPARVRTETGRILTGQPNGERRMEMLL